MQNEEVAYFMACRNKNLNHSHTGVILAYKALKVPDNLKNSPVIMYRAECWTIFHSDEPNRDMFQRIVL
jgi:hypothetical protein